MQVPPPLHAAENAATGKLVGPTNVEFAGVVKSAWNFHRSSELVLKATKKFGEPAGGAALPSRSDGSSPPYTLLSWKQICDAAVAAIIALRLNAQARPPTKVLPLNMLKLT